MDINQSSEEKLNHEDSFVIVDNRIRTTARTLHCFRHRSRPLCGLCLLTWTMVDARDGFSSKRGKTRETGRMALMIMQRNDNSIF